LFTDLPLDEISRLEALEGAQINAAKIVLANEVTKLVRGEDAAVRAEATALETFAGSGAGEDLPSIATGPEGMRLAALLTGVGLTASGGEAKRKLAEGAVKLDGETVTDPAQLVLPDEGQTLRISLGKKRHALVTR
ncbi:MAG: RNA-binding S4 domain-containing protein, partial [Porphyrobacter sp.]|nr:RNA-binding S4 domain-containing protein [Porphyrobacter sp.]